MISLKDWFYFKKNALVIKLRAIKNYYFFRVLDIQLGHNVFIRRGKGRHFFGKRVRILDNSLFEVHSALASIRVGNDCFFSYGVIIVCSKFVEIGNDVWVGEYTSIRDATHVFSVNQPLGSKPDITEPIKIGNNVWIGRGCLILPGSIIEENVVIAANSVVKGFLKAGSLYGGTPAKFIKVINGA